MKIKRGNLLTIFLAMLCAAAVALGVGFALPKNEAKSAHAATLSSVTVGVSFGTQKAKTDTADFSGVAFCDLNAPNPTYISSSASGSTGSGNITSTITTREGAAISVLVTPIIVSVNIPAHTVYKIKYKTSFSMASISGNLFLNYITAGWTPIDAANNAAENYSRAGGFGSRSGDGSFSFEGSGISGWSAGQTSAGNVAGYGLTMYNNTNSATTIYAYAFHVAVARGGYSGSSSFSYTYYFTIDNFEIESAASIADPATTATSVLYDGNDKIFNFTYDSPTVTDYDSTINYNTAYKNIKPTVISAEYPDGSTAIASSTYELENLDTNDIPTSVNGTFKATEAGTYKIGFDLTSAAIANGITWDDGTTAQKTLTFTINPIKLPVPTIQNTTQIYAPGGKSFNLVDPTKFDSTTMNALTVPAVSSDITWNSGNKCFDVTKAGTYTVKFELQDKGNYVWDVGAIGTTADQTATVKLEPKKLTVPTVQNTTQTYDPSKNGCYFSVTGLDPNTMNAETVPATSTDIIWNAAGTRFEAKKAGTHTVQFVLKNKDNYVWDVGANGTTDDQQKTVKVDPKPLTIPTITAPQQYTGSALQFVLSNFNSGTDISMDGVTAANGSTVTGASGAAISDTTDTFEAVKVGTYTVSLSLRNSTNYAWSDGTTLPKDIDFEITQKELLSTPPVSSKVNGTGGAEWEFGDNTVTITITDARVTGENINLLCYYDVQGGTSKANTLTINTVGNVTTITMPATIAVGNYTLTVELNGSTGDNANYKITQNNTLNFKVTSGKLDPSTYGWIYTKDGAAGSTIADGDKLPFVLKAGSATDGVKYELSIQIPSSDSFVTVDTTKHTSGYLTRSGDSVNTFKTVVALKSTDPNNLFEVDGNKQDTCEVELNWEIVKGTFNLTNVKWEYSLNGTSGWTEYNSSNPPQYNDGYDITVRVKASTLPLGLTLDSLYTGVKESDVNNHTATISASDFVYNSANFNAPNTSSLTLNWQIAKKNLFKGFKNVAEPFTNPNYSGNIILKQLDLGQPYAGYIDYVYYDLDNGGTIVTLQDIKDAVDLTNPHNYKVEVNIKPAYAANYTVDDSGAIPTDQFKTGSNNKLADAAIDNATAVYDGNTHFDVSHVTVTGSDSMNVTDFTVKYYKGTSPVASNELPAGDLPKDAGDYCIEVILGTMAESKYILVTDRLIVKIEAMGIAVPTLGTITFNGNEQKFEDYLSGASWTTYGPAGMNIIKVDGKISDRNVGSGNYTTTLEITDSNYKWIDPSTASTTKATVKFSLAADEVKPTVNGDCTVATYEWNIKPLIVDSTNMWNKGSKGATLNLPQNIKDLIAGGTLEVGYRYYDSDGVFVETPEMKSGRTFKVEAVFTGDDSARNVQFKRSDTDFGAVSKSIDYTVPTSGAAAFIGNVKAFMSKTWFGLPIWAWLLIALALIILLIIIIVVAKKRAKTKEEREAKKAAKEEEKQRREEERRMQQERMQAEREIAMAKQQAELEKIRMQSGMAGAGMATMAMQQAMPTPTQYAQQAAADNSAMQRMEAELAEMRAKLAAVQTMPAQPAAVQTYLQSGQPVQAGGLDDIKMQLALIRAEQQANKELSAMKTELEMARLASHGYTYGQRPQNAPFGEGMNAELLGDALIAAFAKLMSQKNAVPEQPALNTVEENVSQPVLAQYPSDAVITTTTTVDTTQKTVRREHDERDGRSDFSDVDGFYDSIDY